MRSISFLEKDSLVWEMVLAYCVLWDNEPGPADSCCSNPCVCVSLLRRPPGPPLVMIAVLHLISDLACLPWLSYSSDFCSLFWRPPPPQVTWLQLVQKRCQLYLQIFALNVVCSFALLLLWIIRLCVCFPSLHVPGEPQSQTLLVDFNALALFFSSF